MAQQNHEKIYERLESGEKMNDLVLIDGLIRPQINIELVWIPPELEGLVLAYHHLLGGHSGEKKLFKLISKRYFFRIFE